MKHATTFLAHYASGIIAWVQRLFLPVSLTLQPARYSGANGAVLQSAQTPVMLVASDMRGRVGFFVP